jgi:putative membrane protein
MPIRDSIVPLFHSRTLAYIGSLALCVGLYSCLPILLTSYLKSEFGKTPSQFHAALSLVLGLLLVFRTNSAYARWWEARTLWGSLVNSSRNLAIKLTCLTKLTEDDVCILQRPLAMFPIALKEHLRRPATPGQSSRSDGQSSDWDHVPAKLVQEIYLWVGSAKANGRIDGHELRVIDLELAKFLEICGGCERIARTPIVRSYRTFARQCILLFLLSLPWGISNDFGWWTIPLAIITTYFMLGMEIVAEHVEEPFGLDEDDLDLEGLCKTIELSVAEIFGNRKTPGVKPVA